MTEQPLAKLSAALVAASAEMPAVTFDAKNPFLHNQFASLGAVIATARPILAKHGLAVMQFACSNEQGHVGVRTRLVHSSGEFLEESIYLEATEEKGKSKAQVAGSIITYLRRYAQSSMLNLYADEDTDGSGSDSTHSVTKRPSTPTSPPKAATAAPGAQGEAKGSASSTPEGRVNALFASIKANPDADPGKKALACKARFLQVIAEKKWEFYAWLWATRSGVILPTERLEDGRPDKFPATAGDYAKAEEYIKGLMQEAAAGAGIRQEDQEAYDMAHLPEAPELVEEIVGDEPEHEAWMDVVLHFGPQKGTALGALDRKKLFGWANNYQPKPFKGKLNPADVALRKALDNAKSWMDENKEGNPF